VHESIIFLLPPPTCIAHTVAMLLQYYCAIFDPPPTPRFLCHTPYNSVHSNSTWGIRIWIFLGEAHKWNIIAYPRIFNDIPFIGSRIFHFEAKSEYNIVFFSSLLVFPTWDSNIV